MTYRSWLTLLNSALFCGLHWILRLAVSTNCPTVALNPDRNALNGYPPEPSCQPDILFEHSYTLP